MKPGDLVQSSVNIHFYSTAQRVNKNLYDELLWKGTIGLILTPTDGTYVKWLVDGKIGWSNWRCLDVIHETG